jgi:hypothetical protein
MVIKYAFCFDPYITNVKTKYKGRTLLCPSFANIIAWDRQQTYTMRQSIPTCHIFMTVKLEWSEYSFNHKWHLKTDLHNRKRNFHFLNINLQPLNLLLYVFLISITCCLYSLHVKIKHKQDGNRYSIISSLLPLNNFTHGFIYNKPIYIYIFIYNTQAYVRCKYTQNGVQNRMRLNPL